MNLVELLKEFRKKESDRYTSLFGFITKVDFQSDSIKFRGNLDKGIESWWSLILLKMKLST